MRRGIASLHVDVRYNELWPASKSPRQLLFAASDSISHAARRDDFFASDTLRWACYVMSTSSVSVTFSALRGAVTGTEPERTDLHW